MISVIIPVYNSEEFLPLLFEGILKQCIENNRFEVIFIDNNSTDTSAELIKRFITSNYQLDIKYLQYKDEQTSYGARNFGVAKSNGEIIAFTDADCIPDKSWLANIYEFYSTEKNSNTIIAGNIVLLLENTKAIWENFDAIGFLNNERTFKSKSGAATANLIVPRKAFIKLGSFLPIKSGGDFEWSLRAYKSIYHFVFMPNILIYHPTRKNYSEIKKKFIRIAEGRAERYLMSREKKLKIVCVEFLRVFNVITILKLSAELCRRTNFAQTLLFIPSFLFLRLHQFRKILVVLYTNNRR